jgi:hypothetical protein
MSVFRLFARRMPGVSIATNDLPSSSNRTSTLSRVVPGTSLTIIRGALTSVLMNVLLPTLRRPTIATFISGPPRLAASSQQRRQLATIVFRARPGAFCSVLTRMQPSPRR